MLREMMMKNIRARIVSEGGGSLYSMRWEPVLTMVVDGRRLNKKEARELNVAEVLEYSKGLNDESFLKLYDLVLRRWTICM